jgi:hypothetical protein
MIGYILVAICLVQASQAADCKSPQGSTCLKKSQMPPGFDTMMLGGDPCFMSNGNRVSR